MITQARAQAIHVKYELGLIDVRNQMMNHGFG